MKGLFFIFLVLFLSSCRSINTVPVETVRTEYQYIDRLQHDSIYERDSVRYYTKGDTVFADKYRYLYKYLFVNKVDSFVKVDTVRVPFPVERQLSRWESLKMELGGWTFFFLACFVMYILYRIIR